MVMTSTPATEYPSRGLRSNWSKQRSHAVIMAPKMNRFCTKPGFPLGVCHIRGKWCKTYAREWSSNNLVWRGKLPPCWMPKYVIRHMQGDGSYIVHRGKLPSCDIYIYMYIYIHLKNDQSFWSSNRPWWWIAWALSTSGTKVVLWGPLLWLYPSTIYAYDHIISYNII